MPPMHPSPSRAPRAAAFERWLRWRVLSIVVFAALMVGLAVTAGFALFAPIHPPSGLPADADVQAARALAHGAVAIPLGPLRFRCELLGAAGTADLGRPATPADDARARVAASRLAGADARRDPRVRASLAALALATRHYDEAERHARAAIDRAPHLAEARLALGVALAMQAELTPEPLRQRGLRLQAIGQLYAVDDGSPVTREALYDRALIETEVGRPHEATAAARAYLMLDPTSPWAARMADTARGRPGVTPSAP